MNPTLLEELGAGERVLDIYASLTDAKTDKPVAGFLYNPESKKFSRSAKYTEATWALASIPYQQYNSTSGLSLQLSDLLLNTYNEGKTCEKILTDLQALMVANPTQGVFTPTPVNFVWGSDKFGPAVITSLDWTETGWLNGKVATARVNLTLLQIPPLSPPPPASEVAANAANSEINLTDRQKQDASTKAKEWLNVNINNIKSEYVDLVKTNSYFLLTSVNGQVKLLDRNKKELIVIGVYNGSEFKPSKEILK
jgi:hypothetical protein